MLDTLGEWHDTEKESREQFAHLIQIDVQRMRTSDCCCKLPCIRKACLAQVCSGAPSEVLQQQRRRLSQHQPHRSRCSVSAVIKTDTAHTTVSAHGSIVRDARDSPPLGPRVRRRLYHLPCEQCLLRPNLLRDLTCRPSLSARTALNAAVLAKPSI